MSTELSRQERNEHWSAVARQYHDHWTKTNDEVAFYAKLEAEWLEKLSGVSAGKRVLDLCCGGGRNTLAIARTGADMVGLDAAPGMIEQARTNARELGLNNVTFVLGDALELPFESESFDAVVGTRFLYMMSRADKKRLLDEIHRVLKPQGKVVLQFNCGFYGIKHEMMNMLRGRKFRLRDRYLWPGRAGSLFKQHGFKVQKIIGTKLPRLALASRLIGERSARRLNSILAIPGMNYLTAYVLVQAQKTA